MHSEEIERLSTDRGAWSWPKMGDGDRSWQRLQSLRSLGSDKRTHWKLRSAILLNPSGETGSGTLFLKATILTTGKTFL